MSDLQYPIKNQMFVALSLYIVQFIIEKLCSFFIKICYDDVFYVIKI